MSIKNIKKTSLFILCGVLLLSGINSCSNLKYLKDGEFLYTGADVTINNDTISKKEKSALKDRLVENLTPKPNSSFLGLRPRLYIYNTTKEPKVKGKGLRNWLKYKIGEEPVLLSDVDREFNATILKNYSENKGYFNAKTSYDTIVKNKKAEVAYQVKTGSRYLMSDIHFVPDSTAISSYVQSIAAKSVLKKGRPFNLDVILFERERINNHLKENGFYFFSPENIIVQADSTVTNKNKVEMFVKLKDDTPQLAKEQFTIDKVVVFPDYNIEDVKGGKYNIPYNTDSLEVIDDFYIVDPKDRFNPRIFDRALYFNRGDLYNRTDHNLSLNRLISLGVFKFVKNEFKISDSASHKFDAYYLLTPRPFKSLRFEALAKQNSANYTGGEVNLNFIHRNAFKGAEQFKMSVFGAFDIAVGGQRDANNIIRVGAKAELSIPRIIAPFRFNTSSAFVPRTNAALSYEFQNRTQLYTLQNLNASFGYLWKENERKEHDLKVMDITYVAPANITEKYQELIDGNSDKGITANPGLGRVTEKQLIFGPTYTYTYTNTASQKTNTYYYKGTLDLAGNLTGLITGADAKNDNQKLIGGIPFSQFVKMEHDVRYYRKIGENSTIASRLIAGIALPYGNSELIPFSRQFSVGGGNSIRAFRARTLGPGSYDPRTQTSSFFFDQAADIKLEANLEYRANIYKFLNAAVFADAGNIWLVNEDEKRIGGKFSKDWVKEIAVGAGVGLRLDFNILLLRLDLAMPLRVPYYNEGERWRFNNIDFGSKEWRRENLLLNIAIGYPF